MKRIMKSQQGVALVMSLIILLVLSLLAVSSMQGSIMQERMSTASREGSIALEAAERGLREAESVIANLNLVGMGNFGAADGTGNQNGWYHIGHAPAVFDDNTWTGAGVLNANTVDGITPQYFFEYRGLVTLQAGANQGSVRNLNFEGRGDAAGGSTAATAEAESVRVVVMAKGPSGQSRKMIEGYYFFKPETVAAGGGE